jgi:hypothetical protein
MVYYNWLADRVTKWVNLWNEQTSEKVGIWRKEKTAPTIGIVTWSKPTSQCITLKGNLNINHCKNFTKKENTVYRQSTKERIHIIGSHNYLLQSETQKCQTHLFHLRTFRIKLWAYLFPFQLKNKKIKWIEKESKQC